MEEGKRTPLYQNHVQYGGKMVEYGGWVLPVSYSSIVKEHQAVRESCGVFDVSHMGEITVKGPAALSFLNEITTNDFSNLRDGRCRYSPVCYESGGTVDDVIVYRRRDEEYLVVVNAANIEKDYGWFVAHQGAWHKDGVTIENISDQVAQIALQGPKYLEVLSKLSIDGKLPDKMYAFTDSMKIEEIQCLVSKTGYTGEPGVEIYLPPADAERLHSLLVEAGALPCGLGARDTLRFECAMPLYGHELAQDITPLECGLASFVKMDKPFFIGKEALEKPVARKRIGLELIDKGIAREHCPVLDANGGPAGFTTSGGPAPSVGKNVAMALVSAEAAEQEEFLIEVRGRRLHAKKVRLPFYRSAAKA